MGTVTKALSLLTFFNQTRTEIGLSDLTRLSGLNKATAYRLMSELQQAGFVEQAGADRAYRLGPEVLRLAALREAAVPILSASRPALDRLSAATGETTHVSLAKEEVLNTIAHAYSPRHATKVMMEDAEVVSYHGTASGLSVLAFADADFVDRVLARPLPAHTGDTLTQPQAIRAQLSAIRADGIAESIGGFEADVHSHAAPIFGPDGKPLGAIAVAAPVTRMTPEARRLIRTELRLAALGLTQSIGGICPPGFPRQVAA
ncbi:IclR family transcriptional regulator [Pseudodonghicola flavimaris]|uniref:IclR family transcriptional regulator n=1 Tax=Pseudodonghicola flavimaris TaxID=3050036 RepID=A0ABT7F324_9RHOB|nr:IclR family transcriptional regulator [Pseudodonghicola flavimaris]MDK3018975.1 IclR family transcriptional regulator [Pseudodonghicola flavimaris]